MGFQASNITTGRQLAKRYEEEVIVPLLFKLKDSRNTGGNEESATVIATVATQSSSGPTDNDNRTIDTIDYFIGEQESAEEREKRVFLSDLMVYHCQPFN